MKKFKIISIAALIIAFSVAYYFAKMPTEQYQELHKSQDSGSDHQVTKGQTVTDGLTQNKKNDMQHINQDLQRFIERVSPAKTDQSLDHRHMMTLISKDSLEIGNDNKAQREISRATDSASSRILSYNDQTIIGEMITNFLLEKDFNKQLKEVKNIKLLERFDKLIAELEEYQKLDDRGDSGLTKIFPIKYPFLEKMIKIEKKSDSRVNKEKLRDKIKQEIDDLAIFIYSLGNKPEYK